MSLFYNLKENILLIMKTNRVFMDEELCMSMKQQLIIRLQKSIS